MLLQELHEARRQLGPVRAGVEVVQDVVAVIECHAIVAAGHAIVGHAVRAAWALRVDEHVLAPAPSSTKINNKAPPCKTHPCPCRPK